MTIWKSTMVATTFLGRLEGTVEMNCQINSSQRTISCELGLYPMLETMIPIIDFLLFFLHLKILYF